MSQSSSDSSGTTAGHHGSDNRGRHLLILLAAMVIAGFVGLIIGAAMMHVFNPPDVQSTNRGQQHSSTSRPGEEVNSNTPGLAQAARSTPYLYILGVTQDAGYPQAGCYEPHCLPGWKSPANQRGAVSLGLVTSSHKYLFEATPSFPSQLFALEQEAPSDSHPLSGIFITHAHIGHYSGLMFLGHEAMGAREVPVYVMPRMQQFLQDNGPWSQLVAFNNISLQSLENRSAVSIDGVTVTPFVVPHRDEFSETVGFRIAGSGKSAVFIPDINKWSDWNEDLVEVIQSTDYALIDAAFFADGELQGRDMSQIPHPFVTETMALLDSLEPNERNKVWFIHMNHTNPLLRIDSEQTQLVEAAGYNVAREGVRLPLQ